MKIAIGGIRGIPARYGGFETSAQETSTRLVLLGCDVSVYCRKNIQSQCDSYQGVKLLHVRAPKVSSFETIGHSLSIALHLIFRQRNVDVVHFYNAASSFGGLLLRLAGIPLVMTLDGVEWEREKWNWVARRTWKAATWLAPRVADVTVCDSRTVQCFFESRYGRKMFYVPYGAKSFLDTTNAYEMFGLKHKEYFLFVGRLVREKGVDTLLEAYRLSGSSIPLVIVGDNDCNKDYVALLKSKAVGDVRFLGFRYGEEYESLLVNARAYLSASKLEGTSPSLLAAMGARVCCLVNAIPENLEAGADAVLYFDGSAQDLASQLTVLSSSTDRVVQYAQAAYDHVRATYNWDDVSASYLKAYESAILVKRRRRAHEYTEHSC